MSNKYIAKRALLPLCKHCGQPFSPNTKHGKRVPEYCSDRCTINSAYYARVKRPWTVPEVKALCEENEHLATFDLENEGLYGDYDDSLEVKGIRVLAGSVKGLTI